MKESSFITDVAFKPSKEKLEDDLGFLEYAKRIAREAMNIVSSESVIFGINGQWGEGKTSMINLVKKELKTNGFDFIDFSPWKTSSGKATTQLFFDVLKEGLNGKIVGINWKINRYAEALLQLDKSGIGKTLWQLVMPFDSIETQKKQLQNAMQRLNKNLVVFVDDLDRLAKNEIADVLKLMRNTANFPNLVFIAAYDRNYLNKAVEETICSYEAKTYMDKIVLWEFKMPNIKKEEYANLLRSWLIGRYKSEVANSTLNVEIPSQDLVGNEVFVQKDITQIQNVYMELFSNIRICKRFYNVFVIDYESGEIKDNVYFNDFLHLTMLKFFFNKEYVAFVAEYVSNHEWIRDETLPQGADPHIEGIKKTISNDYEIPNTVKTILEQIFKAKDSLDEKSLGHYKNRKWYFYRFNNGIEN